MDSSVLHGKTPVGVVATNSCDYVATVLDLLEQGEISVALRSADDHERITRSGIVKVIEPGTGTGWIAAPFRSPNSDLPAQISFTSGTEGEPKAVLLSQGNLHNVVVRLTEVQELNKEIREYIGVPVYHSFGYGRCRAVLHAGGQCYIPAGGFDLNEIRELLQQGRINAISAVPSLWRLFMNNSDLFGAELEQVRWVEIGSQYMSGDEKSALKRLLPNARIVQHYGLTEASRTSFLCVDSEPESALESVGRACGAVDIRVSADGIIEIKGPHVANAVFQGDRKTFFGPEDWFTTSDKGRIENGLLFFEGRADDLINCSGIKLSPEKLESQVREELGATGDFCITRKADPLRGDSLLLVITPDSAARQQEILEGVSAISARQGVALGSSITVFHMAELPRTATGKIQRKQISEQYAEAVRAAVPEEAGSEAAAQKPSDLFRPLSGGRPLDTRQSFVSLGGDSLQQMEMSIALRRMLGHAPAGWESLPMDTLDELAADPAALEQSALQPDLAPPLPRGDTNQNPEGIAFWDLVREDLKTNDGSLFSQGFWMLFIHRFGNWRMGVRCKFLRMPLTVVYRILNKLAQIVCGIKLDYTVRVGRRVKLEHFGGMIIGARAIGNDVYIRQNTTMGIRSVDDLNAKPTIGNGVDIGAGAVIVGNIRVGDNSIIGANSVVYSNVPDNSIVSVGPARLLGSNPRINPSPLPGYEKE